MIIIPVGKRLNWRKPPVATLLLVTLNVLAFFFIQGRDPRLFHEALAFYSHSILPRVELPRYLDYLEENGEYVPKKLKSRLDDSAMQSMVVMRMQYDGKFMAKLHRGQVISAREPNYAKWRTQRARFEELLGRTSIERYGFKPAQPTLMALFGHMFMHGGFGHLFGNMIFLFLVGVMVESVLGRRLFLASYFVGGLCAVGLFSAVYPHSSIPLVGASGAIAGLMGLYTVCFGTRKVEFFYSLLFYFDYVKAPAIVLLPLWLGNEFFQLFWNQHSHIAYVAHIGGLATGALLGAGYRKWLPQRFAAFHAAADDEESFTREYQRGQALLGALQLDKAQRVFEALRVQRPDHRPLLKQLYHIAKFHPDREDYHQAAARIFRLPEGDADTAQWIHATYLEYTRLAKPQPRFNADTLSRLAMRFAGGGHTADAERLVNYLMRRQPGHTMLPALILALAKAFFRDDNAKKYHSYLGLVARLFPEAKEAAVATELLKK